MDGRNDGIPIPIRGGIRLTLLENESCRPHGPWSIQSRITSHFAAEAGLLFPRRHQVVVVRRKHHAGVHFRGQGISGNHILDLRNSRTSSRRSPWHDPPVAGHTHTSSTGFCLFHEVHLFPLLERMESSRAALDDPLLEIVLLFPGQETSFGASHRHARRQRRWCTTGMGCLGPLGQSSPFLRLETALPGS